MGFIDNIKRQQQENRRAACWSEAVRQLCWFIRQYLRNASAGSGLTVKPDLLRVEHILLNRLTIFLDGETVSVTPVGLGDARAPERGGCVVLQSTNGVAYNLLWNGDSPNVVDQWQIAQANRRVESGKIQLDHFAVSFDQEAQDLEPLSERSLDEALDCLFGLAERIRPPRGVTSRPSRQPSGFGAAPFVFSRRPFQRDGMLNLNGVTEARKVPRA